MDHDTESRTCWCNPRVEQVCPRCDGLGGNCRNCEGTGWVTVYDDEEPAVIIHNDVEHA